MKLMIINGPNLNLLGKREVALYGSEDFETYFQRLKQKYAAIEFEYFQSNIEGEIVTSLQGASGKQTDGVVLNAAGYTHTSVAIADAVAAVKVPVIEVHITQILRRETFRHVSLIAPHCIGTIAGFGLGSYELAVVCFSKISEIY